ncbi:hypothetical protein, partial [Candidatus Venteria ishoeyi]|uniref:hypothetical protein n=1 Tax=Candidatus Venteria ishoeyi TaxID=1899563 RepID=UPI0015AB6614
MRKNNIFLHKGTNNIPQKYLLKIKEKNVFYPLDIFWDLNILIYIFVFPALLIFTTYLTYAIINNSEKNIYNWTDYLFFIVLISACFLTMIFHTRHIFYKYNLRKLKKNGDFYWGLHVFSDAILFYKNENDLSFFPKNSLAKGGIIEHREFNENARKSVSKFYPYISYKNGEETDTAIIKIFLENKPDFAEIFKKWNLPYDEKPAFVTK